VLEYDAPVTSRDTTADRVLGQKGSFTKAVCADGVFGNPPVTARTLCDPLGMATDAADNLYVVDALGGRVLSYANPITHDDIADLVLGEPDFTTDTFCNGGPTSPSDSFFCGVGGIAIDSGGNLYLGDGSNNRVLAFDAPLSTGMAAARELGQIDFVHATINFQDGRSMQLPSGVAVDLSVTPNRLYVVDSFNSRVLGFKDVSAFANGASADLVIGQADLLSSGASGPESISPTAAAVDWLRSLFPSTRGSIFTSALSAICAGRQRRSCCCLAWIRRRA
jgi:sugar lactone lactonase YvrE